MEKNTNNINTFNVNMDNLSEEEREQLIALVEKSNEKKNKVWKLKHGEMYFYFLNNGRVESDYFKDGLNDNLRYKIGNCFKTNEEAEFFAEKQRVMTQLKRYAEEHNKAEINWDDYKQYKYFLLYNNNIDRLCVGSRNCCMFPNQVYFTSADVAENAVKEIGEDRIKKYLFGVETAK